MKNNQSGVAHLGVVLVVVVVMAAAGFAVWNVYQNNQGPTTQETSSTDVADDAPEVNNADDLKQAEEFVKSTDVDNELDTSEVDSTLRE